MSPTAAFFGKPRWSYYEDIAFFRRNPVHSEEGRAHFENIINL